MKYVMSALAFLAYTFLWCFYVDVESFSWQFWAFSFVGYFILWVGTKEK